MAAPLERQDVLEVSPKLLWRSSELPAHCWMFTTSRTPGLQEVARNLPVPEMLRCRQVCKAWRLAFHPAAIAWRLRSHQAADIQALQRKQQLFPLTVQLTLVLPRNGKPHHASILSTLAAQGAWQRGAVAGISLQGEGAGAAASSSSNTPRHVCGIQHLIIKSQQESSPVTINIPATLASGFPQLRALELHGWFSSTTYDVSGRGRGPHTLCGVL